MPKTKHEWKVTPTEAIVIQRELRAELRHIPLTRTPRFIAGADVSSNRFEHDLYAGIIVLTYPALELVESVCVKQPADLPYIPGLLSFREIPALLECYAQLKQKPNIIMVDGHGIAHPRRLGIAAHFGLVTQTPTLGCAKNLLYGETNDELGPLPGDRVALIDKKHDEVIGCVLRTKQNVKPVFISPGHLLDLETAVSITLETTKGYRLPEPTRRAHLLVNEFRRSQNLHRS